MAVRTQTVRPRIYRNEGGFTITCDCGGCGGPEADCWLSTTVEVETSLTEESLQRALNLDAALHDQRPWMMAEGIAWCPVCWEGCCHEAFLEHVRIEDLVRTGRYDKQIYRG